MTSHSRTLADVSPSGRLGLCATAAAALLVTALAPAASASPLPDGGATAREVSEVLLAKGYAAQMDKDPTGDSMIRSGAEGTKFSVIFYGCKDGPRCTSIQFSAAWHVDGGMQLSTINTWNTKHRFGQAHLDDVNDPWVRMDIDLERGYTTEAIANDLDRWVAVLGDFKHFMYCDEPKHRSECPESP